MKYHIVTFLGQNKYDYNMLFDHSESREDLGTVRDRIVRLKQHFDGKALTCYAYYIYSLNTETGEMELIEHAVHKHPLKSRVEINKEAKARPKTKSDSADYLTFAAPVGLFNADGGVQFATTTATGAGIAAQGAQMAERARTRVAVRPPQRELDEEAARERYRQAVERLRNREQEVQEQ